MGDDNYDDLFANALGSPAGGKRYGKRRGGGVLDGTPPALASEFSKNVATAREAATLVPGSAESAGAQQELAGTYFKMNLAKITPAALEAAAAGWALVDAIGKTAVATAKVGVVIGQVGASGINYLIAAGRARPATVVGTAVVGTAIATTAGVISVQSIIAEFKALPDADTKKQVLLWFIFIGNFMKAVAESAVLHPKMALLLALVVAIAGQAIASKQDEIWGKPKAEMPAILDIAKPSGDTQKEIPVTGPARRRNSSRWADATPDQKAAASAIADGPLQGGRRRSTSRRRRRAAYLPRQTRRSSSGRRQGYSRRRRE